MTFGELFLIYAWLQVSTIKFALIIFMVLSATLGAMIYSHIFDCFGEDVQKKALKFLRRIHIPSILIALFLVTFVPSSQTIGIMIAGDQAMKALRSDTGQKLTGKAGEVIDRALDRALESLADKSEK